MKINETSPPKTPEDSLGVIALTMHDMYEAPPDLFVAGLAGGSKGQAGQRSAAVRAHCWARPDEAIRSPVCISAAVAARTRIMPPRARP